MRPLAYVGVLLALLVAGLSVFSVAETAANRRNTQDRALEEATGREVERVLGAERQMHAVAMQMAANPSVRALISRRVGASAARARDLHDASAALATFRREALLPLSSACIERPGAQIVCVPQPRIALPSAITARFAALAAAAPLGAGSRPFISPVTGRPTVAVVSALPAGGPGAGLAHFDIDLAYIEGSRLLIDDVPGVHLALGGYEDGHLIVPGGGAQPLARRALHSVRLSAADAGPWSMIAGGRRQIAAVVPLVVADRHRQLAILATSTAPEPTLLNAWDTGRVAMLVLALLMLIGSVAALVASGRSTQRELRTDALTRLRNRRALMDDLQRACQRAGESNPAYLWFFDLNGFKHYNDAFGHLAGDVMLTRLGRRLADAVGSAGRAYRLGGDEFCALITAPRENPLDLFETAREALGERGGAFAVTASAGAVEIPRDASEPELALRLADQHMYRDKATTRSGTADLVTAVLHAALAQRHPELDDHSSDVASDVERLARAVGLDDDAVEMVIRAGDLHDVGKLGIPDEIIDKPGPLSDREWEFMHQHTVMGERIIAAAGPSLERIAPLVRASHERWDGAGYPDGLAAEGIPLGARIITICDSFRAMLSARAYKPAMPMADALAELRRCAGTQFDPSLVEVFCAIVEDRGVADGSCEGTELWTPTQARGSKVSGGRSPS
jgi:diguanylate cyclase (GGDEF)-like protein